MKYVKEKDDVTKKYEKKKQHKNIWKTEFLLNSECKECYRKKNAEN